MVLPAKQLALPLAGGSLPRRTGYAPGRRSGRCTLHGIQAPLKATIDLYHYRPFLCDQKIDSIAAYETKPRDYLFRHLGNIALGGSRGVIFPLYLNPFAPVQEAPMSCSLTARAHASWPLPMTETLAAFPEISSWAISPFSHSRSDGSSTLLQPTPPAPLRGLTRIGKSISSAEAYVFMKGKPDFFQPGSQPELIRDLGCLFRRIVEHGTPKT